MKLPAQLIISLPELKTNLATLRHRLLAVAAGALLLGCPTFARAESAAPAKDAAMQGLVNSFTSQRQALLAQRQAIIARLRAAKTPAERQAILNEAKQNEQAMLSSQHDLAKQLRDQIKQARDSHRGAPGG